MMKKNYKEMTKPERQAEYAAVKAEFEGAKALHLELNMARGKPSRQQLDMVTPMLQVLTQPEQFVSDGVEIRNYGEVGVFPRRGSCSPTSWAASRSRCSWAAMPACS